MTKTMKRHERMNLNRLFLGRLTPERNRLDRSRISRPLRGEYAGGASSSFGGRGKFKPAFRGVVSSFKTIMAAAHSAALSV